MLLMATHALFGSGLLVMAKLLTDWPFFRIFGFSYLVAGVCFAIIGVVYQAALPKAHMWKWLFSRGFFALLYMLSQSSAVRLGASTGDVAALSSINIVVAAVLGRVFLGEPLQRLHVVAMCCCILGAVCISRPQFLFGGSGGDSAWGGYVLAVLAGFMSACVAISCRKAGNASMHVMNSSACILNGIGFMALPYTPLIDDSSLRPMLISPFEALGLIGTIFIVTVLSTAANTGGSAWCPAAVSSTINTAARMVFGYFAESIIFGKVPDLLTVCGAVAMLGGVVIMALARLPARQSKTVPASTETSGVADLQPKEDVEPAGDDDDEDNESLVSFIATEFVDVAAHDMKPVRQRRRSNSEVNAQRIGAWSAVMPCVA